MHSNFSKRIRTDGNQIFSVPNTEEGLYFLHLLSKYGNFRKYKYDKKGRGGGKTYKKWNGDTPLNDSKWIAIYLRNKKDVKKAKKAVTGEVLTKCIMVDNNKMRMIA